MKRLLPACLVALAVLLCSSCGNRGAVTRQVLGTVCTVNLYDDGSDRLYGIIFDRLQEIDSEFNLNSPASDLNRINEAAGLYPVEVCDDIARVLEAALYYAQKSGGAFDPTIGPLVRLWDISGGGTSVPSQEEIDAVLPLVDWTQVQLIRDGGTNTVFLKQPGMVLDLGGIAKGFAADELASIMQSHKVRRALIDLGGNIYAWGDKPDGSAWKIGVKNPRDQGSGPLVTLRVQGGSSVVTSGVYERYFIQDGTTYHHILNPRTGYPMQNGILSTTIVSSSSMAADALSTTSFLLGPEIFFQAFEEPALFIMEDLSVEAAPGLEYEINGQSSE